jgi:hypothetical protein
MSTLVALPALLDRLTPAAKTTRWRHAARTWVAATGEPRYYASELACACDPKMRVAEVAGCTCLLRRTSIMGRNALILYAPPIPKLPGGSWRQAAHALELLRSVGVGARLSEADLELLGSVPGTVEPHHEEHTYSAERLVRTKHVRYCRNRAAATPGLRLEVNAAPAPATVRAMRHISAAWRAQRHISSRLATTLCGLVELTSTAKTQLIWMEDRLVAFSVLEQIGANLHVGIAEARDYTWQSPVSVGLLLHLLDLEAAGAHGRISTGAARAGANGGVEHHKNLLPAREAPITIYNAAAHRPITPEAWAAIR